MAHDTKHWYRSFRQAVYLRKNFAKARASRYQLFSSILGSSVKINRIHSQPVTRPCRQNILFLFTLLKPKAQPPR